MLIPKIFHQIWIGGNPLPSEFEFYRQTWKDLHPDWEFMVWTDDNLPDELINQQSFDEAEGIVCKVDLLKLEVIYKYGGIFIDSDFECYKNIEKLIENLDVFSAGEKEGIIGNAIMGATPKHPVFLKIINAAPQSIKENVEFGPNIKTGPIFMTKILNFSEIHVFGPAYFFPIPPTTKESIRQSDKYPGAYAIHHWAGSWVGKEEKKSWDDWSKENRQDWQGIF
jgi:mannosyltransferase OCH1-like enzyme